MKLLLLKLRIWWQRRKIVRAMQLMATPRWVVPALPFPDMEKYWAEREARWDEDNTRAAEHLANRIGKHTGRTKYQARLMRIAAGRKRKPSKRPFEKYAQPLAWTEARDAAWKRMHAGTDPTLTEQQFYGVMTKAEWLKHLGVFNAMLYQAYSNATLERLFSQQPLWASLTKSYDFGGKR